MPREDDKIEELVELENGARIIFLHDRDGGLIDIYNPKDGNYRLDGLSRREVLELSRAALKIKMAQSEERLKKLDKDRE